MAPDRRRTPATSPAPAVAGPPRLQIVPGHATRSDARVRDVRARILAGYYDRDDVRSRLADAVLRQMRRG